MNKLGKLLSVFTILFIILFHVQTIEKFPEVFVDEALTLKRVSSFIEKGEMDGHFYQKIYDFIGYNVSADAFLSSAIFSLGTKIIPRPEFYSIRHTVLFFGFIYLLACFLIAKKFAGNAAAVLSIFLISLGMPFIQGAHIARPDMMAIALATLALAYSLYYNKGFVRGLICGLAIGIAFELHARACIAGFAIFSYHALITRLSCFKKSWIWGYIIGGGCGLMLYYLTHIKSSNPAVLKTLYTARAPSGFSLDLWEISLSVIEFINAAVRFQGPIAIAFILIFAIPFLDKKKELKKLLLLTALVVFASGAFIQYKVHFKIIAGSPFLDILLAAIVVHFYKWSRLNKASRTVFASACVLLIAQFSYAAIKPHINNPKDCFVDFKNIGLQISKVIDANDHIMADETYWISLNEHPYTAWKALRYYQNYTDGASLLEGMKFFRPDVLIIDQNMSYFISDTAYLNPFRESLRISANELRNILDTRSETLTKIESECYGNILVSRLNWEE